MSNNDIAAKKKPPKTANTSRLKVCFFLMLYLSTPLQSPLQSNKFDPGIVAM